VTRSTFFASSPDPGARPQPSRLRILVADDDRDAVASLEALLNDEGHQTRGVYHGRDVVDMITAFAPHIVLLDIGMPGMSGYDIARELRERFGGAKPPLIAITGWSKSADKLMAKAAGFDHHFAKPYDPKELLSLITRVGEEQKRGI